MEMSENKNGIKPLPAILGIIIVIAALIFVNRGFDEGEIEDYEEELVPAHEVAEVTEAHLEDAKRYEYHVHIKEAVDVEALRHLSHYLLKDAQEELTFNGLAISFYDRKEYIMRLEPTLGQSVFAPEGHPDRVDEVEAGDYEAMEFSWSLRQKDWDEQPSQKSAEIRAAWQDLYDKVSDRLERNVSEKNIEVFGETNKMDNYIENVGDEKTVYEEAVTAAVARKFDRDVEEIEGILEEIRMWSLMSFE